MFWANIYEHPSLRGKKYPPPPCPPWRCCSSLRTHVVVINNHSDFIHPDYTSNFLLKPTENDDGYDDRRSMRRLKYNMYLSTYGQLVFALLEHILYRANHQAHSHLIFSSTRQFLKIFSCHITRVLCGDT